MLNHLHNLSSKNLRALPGSLLRLIAASLIDFWRGCPSLVRILSSFGSTCNYSQKQNRNLDVCWLKLLKYEGQPLILGFLLHHSQQMLCCCLVLNQYSLQILLKLCPFDFSLGYHSFFITHLYVSSFCWCWLNGMLPGSLTAEFHALTNILIRNPFGRHCVFAPT